MMRAAAKRLRRPLQPPQGMRLSQRYIRSNVIQNQAVPAVATQHASNGAFFSWLFKNKQAVSVPPLYEPLEGVNLPPPLADHIKPVETKVSKLSNGVTIASENIPGPTATIGLYVDSGSVYEDQSNSGSTHLLEKMAFKSTKNRTHFRLVREVEAIGGNILASASREQMSYTGDVIKNYMPAIVELIVDSVRNPVFNSWEIAAQVAGIKDELNELSKNPQTLLLEALHTAGYEGALSKPLLAPESAIQRLTPDILSQFVAENYTAPRMVLAASGVDHDELLSIATPLLEDLPSLSSQKSTESKYVGGDWRVQADTDKTHVAVAFEVPGGWRNEKDAIAATVLQTLLGGGGSFSAGGPGKGMYSRLYTRVLNGYGEVESFTAFSSIYNDSGLFGIHATSGSDFAENLINLITNELIEVATPGRVKEIELERAKNTSISLALMNLESRVVITEDIGRQILTYGDRKPVREYIDAVRCLTLEDITNIAEKIILTPITVASWGDVVHVPRYDDIASRFSEEN